jgi:CheY-like chemotaxis protein
MVSETENKNNLESPEKSLEKSSATQRYSLIALACLVAAVVLLLTEQKLIAGCFIIAAASLGLVIYRKVSALSAQYKDSVNELIAMNEKQDDVISDFSHKIREPLNNLVIISDMLMESGLQKRQEELVETFIASTNNMVTTVNELAMQTAGNLGYEQRKSIKFNIVSTIENTFDLYRLKDKANLEFILNKKDLKDTEYFGDPIIIKQIFLELFNIIENHASEKAITVTINLKKISETADEDMLDFRIQVDESIILIDKQNENKSLAARLIYAGKGGYDQEAGPNHTVLHISLPFAIAHAEPRPQPVSQKFKELTPREKIRKDLKDLRVLLVEDNIINQKITLLTLSKLVGSIETASNGKEALDKFGKSNYDLILMDIQMPVMSGLMAAEKIRALESATNSHVPIIAITANAMIGDKEKCLAVGIDDYISKPFQPSALVEKIRMVI